LLQKGSLAEADKHLSDIIENAAIQGYNNKLFKKYGKSYSIKQLTEYSVEILPKSSKKSLPKVTHEDCEA
jgi:hypothetical protein